MSAIIIITGVVIVMAMLFMLATTSYKPVFAPITDIEGVTRMKAAALDFKKDVLESPIPVLVDFWAPWCGPCRMISPVIEGIAEKTSGKAKVVQVNVDEHQEIAIRYGIQGIPTVMVFKKGEIADTLVGARHEQDYMNALGL